MSAPSDLETKPEPQNEAQEIVLRLGDILPRVPSHLIKPGPHDNSSQVRFVVDELAVKIARGRVTVPLDRLTAACPGVFRPESASPDEREVQLPLQKLLEQVGLVARKAPAPNGVPFEHAARARAKASVIIEAATTRVVNPPPAPAAPIEPEPARKDPADSTAQPLISKAISSVLGLFGRSDEPKPPEKPIAEEKEPVTPPKEGASAKIEPPANVEPPSPQPAADAPTPPPETTTPEPAAQPTPTISLRLLPIFRLLPTKILRPGPLPSKAALAAFPLAAIETQLAEGHVEIPINDFIKALPEDLRPMLNPLPHARVWIPLDEIFQSLPLDHPFYMPPFGDSTTTIIEPPTSEPTPKKVDEPKPSEATPEAAQTPPADPNTPEPEPPAAEANTESAPEPPTAQAAPEPAPEPSAAQKPEPPAAQFSEPEPQPTPEPPPLQRVPWMHGFQVPPPILLRPEPALAENPSEPDSSADTASMPEARRTADFLANQPGIFAAAAFVKGAVFASADFPRKPDLDALRDFIGSFVDHAKESGQRLGWNRIVTIDCDQFHATTVVRDTHFVVALHYDRLLGSVAHDALIAAADDLSTVA